MSEPAPKIGIRLANGRYFALYKDGEMGKKRLQLIPARNNQNVAEIKFVHYGIPGSEPASIGKIRCTDIQAEKKTLTLNMALSDSDSFTVFADYLDTDSNPVKTKEIKIKLEPFPSATAPTSPTSNTSDIQDTSESSKTPDFSSNKFQKPTAIKKIFRHILGTLFIVICLLIILYTMNKVTEWGSFRAFTHPAS